MHEDRSWNKQHWSLLSHGLDGRPCWTDAHHILVSGHTSTSMAFGLLVLRLTSCYLTA